MKAPKNKTRITVSAPDAVRAALTPQTLAAVQIYGLLKPLSLLQRERVVTKALAMLKADNETLHTPDWCQ